MPRDAVSRTANVGTWLRKRNGGKKCVNQVMFRVMYQFTKTCANTFNGVYSARIIFCLFRYSFAFPDGYDVHLPVTFTCYIIIYLLHLNLLSESEIYLPVTF